ncbi:MAG TPA: FTR1 family protein [Candidatus Methylacidiphilales bacterium]|nr:FTR1 family protein [Candidatus Methylacidiphilales bacterium]
MTSSLHPQSCTAGRRRETFAPQPQLQQILAAVLLMLAVIATPVLAETTAPAPASASAAQPSGDVMQDFENVRAFARDITVDAAGAALQEQQWTARHAEAKTLLVTLSAHFRAHSRETLPEPTFINNRQAAEWAGVTRARLEHLAATEMLAAQKQGDITSAQTWRALISMPKHANAVEGALALQRLGGTSQGAEGVSQLLAREVIMWQSSRIREKLEAARRLILSGHPTLPLLAGRAAEIDALAATPAPLMAAAEVPAAAPGSGAGKTPSSEAASLSTATSQAWLDRVPIAYANPIPAGEKPVLPEGFTQWRERIELALPNLLTETEINRRERLVLKLLRLIPKEYDAGVREGQVVVPIEYREAVVFTANVDEIINELAPAWRVSKAQAAADNAAPLAAELTALDEAIAAKAPSAEIHRRANAALSILEGKYGLTLFRSGARQDVVNEMLLEVRTSLLASLAEARAGRWQQAEAMRLDAYSTFDTEIEIRAMTRDAALAIRTERSFLEGVPGERGIKALLDQRAPIAELEAAYQRTLGMLDECGALLKVIISPATIIFQAFTIVAREGLEAVVILAALLAGMRGDAYARQRRNIAIGSMLAVVASVAVFWLSQTLIASLMKYGEHLEAVISFLAVIILLMVTNWVFHKYYWVGWNANLRKLVTAVNQSGAATKPRGSKQAIAASESLDADEAADAVETAKSAPKFSEDLAMIGVGFLTIFREGFETTLFMQSLMFDGGTQPVSIGFGIGVVSIFVLGWLIFVLGNKLPYRKMLVITGILVVSILMTFTGSTVRIFQTIGWLPIHPIEGLTIPSWMGLWLGLYPSWEGIVIPLLSLVYVAGAWLYVKFTSSTAPVAEEGPKMVDAAKLAKQQKAEAAAESHASL